MTAGPARESGPDAYWSATTGDLVEYRTGLERAWLTLLDFDPGITAFATRPLRFGAVDDDGPWRHAPFVLARRADGRSLVLETDEPAPGHRAERVRRACAELGWDHRRVGEPDRQRRANVEFLSGARRPVHLGAELAPRLLRLARGGTTIGGLLARMPYPDLARGVLFHLMWHHRVVADLDVPLREATLVTTAGEPA
ncbi:TnsA-like heteromeric transposase endonuclease subunit [Kitasatospora sp. NPDC059408]|uniref:TnsA-like heteromeric transposase endonuclease subunit n=1 Tax=Kitasatospora sp. NPDC059408 TaxID=3346823 RepID=UPI0036B74EA2